MSEEEENNLVPVEREEEQSLAPFEVVRTETVLSQFPIHTLSKKGKVEITFRKQEKDGVREIKWKVSPNAEFGEPRQLAYKLDTLVVNKKIT